MKLLSLATAILAAATAGVSALSDEEQAAIAREAEDLCQRLAQPDIPHERCVKNAKLCLPIRDKMYENALLGRSFQNKCWTIGVALKSSHRVTDDQWRTCWVKEKVQAPVCKSAVKRCQAATGVKKAAAVSTTCLGDTLLVFKNQVKDFWDNYGEF